MGKLSFLYHLPRAFARTLQPVSRRAAYLATDGCAAVNNQHSPVPSAVQHFFTNKTARFLSFPTSDVETEFVKYHVRPVAPVQISTRDRSHCLDLLCISFTQ